VIRLVALAALLAVSACSIAPFQKGTPAETRPPPAAGTPKAGEGPVLKTPTDEIFQPDAEAVIETPPPVVDLPRERPRRPPATLAPASRALVAQAETQRKKGDLPGASVSLDRALRIEPNNPLLWIEMGRLRMDQRNYPQAENMARKALSMSVGDDATQSAAWELIGQSLKARGRNSEAEEALGKARAAAPR
jgi:tetratricopeptide (TPR) repeat protein